MAYVSVGASPFDSIVSQATTAATGLINQVTGGGGAPKSAGVRTTSATPPPPTSQDIPQTPMPQLAPAGFEIMGIPGWALGVGAVVLVLFGPKLLKKKK